MKHVHLPKMSLLAKIGGEIKHCYSTDNCIDINPSKIALNRNVTSERILDMPVYPVIS